MQLSYYELGYKYKFGNKSNLLPNLYLIIHENALFTKNLGSHFIVKRYLKLLSIEDGKMSNLLPYRHLLNIISEKALSCTKSMSIYSYFLSESST